MSKQSLVYLRSSNDDSGHIGCGVVVAGGLIATCRHVWEDASAEGAVLARFPFPPQEELRGRSLTVRLHDACRGDADLVLLAFAGKTPRGLAQAALAHEGRHQAGDCYCHARLPTRRTDDELPGVVSNSENEDGLRTFTATRAHAYWFEKGSSGAPVYREGGALVGLLRERDLGGDGQPDGLRMSFIVPASAIWPHLMRAAEAVADRHIPADEFQDLLIAIGEEGLAPRDIPRRLMEIVAAQKAAATEPVQPSNLGGGVTEAIRTSRDLLGRDGAGAALASLNAAIEREHERRVHAELAERALLRERAQIERLALRYDAARATYGKLAALDPDDEGWAFIEIGDIERHLGRSGAALAAYRQALARTRENTRPRGLAEDRIGDWLAAQGDGAGALDAFRRSLAIAERLAADDPASVVAQRDLSVSLNKIGDALAAQGDGAGALEAFRRSLAIRERLAADDPASVVAQRDLSVSLKKIGDRLAAQGEGAGALNAFRRSLAIDERLATDDPASVVAQRDLSVSLDRIGDRLAAQGDGAGALDAFRRSLAIFERLAADDPARAQAQRDLSISLERIGDRLAAQGDGAGALEAFRRSLAIRERLAADDPASVDAQRDLIVSCVKLSEADAEAAAVWVARALGIAEALAAEGRLEPRDAWMPTDLRKRLEATTRAPRGD